MSVTTLVLLCVSATVILCQLQPAVALAIPSSEVGDDNVNLDGFEEEKRAKAGWQGTNGLWGKRAWNSANGLWGKRGNWQSANGVWGKRASWNAGNGLWGKRDWLNSNGMFGKRDFVHNYSNEK